MSTLYDLFKVKENATPDEIKEAYDKILKKADSLPQNEKIIEQTRRIKIAYGILSDPEKREKYDMDLATKRADELLQNVQTKEEPQEEKFPQINEERLKQEIENQINEAEKHQNIRELQEKLEEQRKAEQIREQQIRKQIKKQERKNRRQAKKEQQLKREMEINAYGEYLQRQGYKVKYPWTWLRVKRLMLSIISVIIAFVIIWHIPFVRKTLINLYNENPIVKFLADMIFSIFNGIIGSIKSIFK